MARRNVPGIALAVVRGGKVIKAKGYGMADLEHKVPVTPETVFKIASISKQFLATGIMILAQDNRLSIDDPMSKYIAGVPEQWNGVTLRHLLTHTSGIVREGPAFDPWKLQPDSEVVASAFSKPLEFAPGSKFQYCNLGYYALADIIARVSGKTWSAFLAERVFGPVGMTATRTTTMIGFVPNRARGYVWQDSAFVNGQDFPALRPSGSILSTVLDLAKWDAALYEDRVLTKASRDAMFSPAKLSTGANAPYGFGWVLDTLDGRRRVRHGGALPGYRSEMARYPNDSLTVIVLTNGESARPDELARDVARIYLRGR
jgi:D-alanyl-D-alanine carboxypeptidase